LKRIGVAGGENRSEAVDAGLKGVGKPMMYGRGPEAVSQNQNQITVGSFGGLGWARAEKADGSV
jgi:hypothetical protein